MPSSTFHSQPSSVTIQQAQLAMNEVPEFAGNVKAIRTDVLVDKAAEELYPGWEKNQEQWKLVGGDHAYQKKSEPRREIEHERGQLVLVNDEVL